jgi:hypothetical protein
MRKIFTTVVLGLAAAGAFAQQPEADAAEAAKVAAQSWLAQIDGAHYAASWDTAAPAFQAAVSKADWEKSIASLRAPMGAVEKRELIAASYKERLLGAPPGPYVVIQYRSQFANKKAAVETLTPMKSADGSWHVSGYFVK